jgi:hypothetical protein
MEITDKGMERRIKEYRKAYKGMTPKLNQVDKEDAFIAGAAWADGHPHWVRVADELPKDGAVVLAYATYEVDGEPGDVVVAGQYFDSVMPEDYNEEEKEWYGPIEQSIHHDSGCDSIYEFSYWMNLYKPE